MTVETAHGWQDQGGLVKKSWRCKLLRHPDTTVADDVDGRTVDAGSGDFVGCGGCAHVRLEVDGIDLHTRCIQRVECCGKRAVRGAIAALAIVQTPKRPLDALVGIFDEGVRCTART